MSELSPLAQVGQRPPLGQTGQMAALRQLPLDAQAHAAVAAAPQPAAVPAPRAGDPLLPAAAAPAVRLPALAGVPLQASGPAATAAASPAPVPWPLQGLDALASAMPRPSMTTESLRPGDRLPERAALDADLADPLAASTSPSAALAQPAVALSPSTLSPAAARLEATAGVGAALAAGAAVDPGRLQLDLQSPDMGQMRLDLAIDPGGNARLVVHAASESAALSLGERTGQLVDAMREMGLSLQVDVRQGGGQGAGANPQPPGSAPSHAVAVRDSVPTISTPAGAAPARRPPAHPRALSFYA